MTRSAADPRQGMHPVPTAVLRDTVAQVLARQRPGARVVAMARSPAPYRSSWCLEDLRVTLGNGAVVEMVFKDLGRPLAGSEADLVKPRCVLDRRREPWVYASILEPVGVGAPAFLGWVSEPENGRHWLFLERIRGVPLAEMGDLETWKAAATWLGRFHCSVSPGRTSGGPLIRHDARLHRGWFSRAVARAREGMQRGAGGGPDGAAAALRRIRGAHDAAAEEIAALPGTLVHGEFYPSNVLLEEGRIRPVDWETAGVGPGLLDLAALISGCWGDGDRAAMVLAYRHAILEAGAEVPPLDRFLRTLTMCRLLLAVQWLGWGRHWEPPPEHRQDWLSEAVRCAEALEGE